ncbi:dUTP diphosphatase [Falsibacillus albus]|uniref:dUTPase n=1 Tax=Falsibacillus albus TaxID=2478915 RepID=A0A3L7K763_9BACI|nr:dUTP diphosphatase [Falsibacillus albus]RLQ97991.1 dUTPase [Falsibacillus albus]
MDLKAMFSMQKELDSFIKKEHGLEKEDLISQKVLALLVEIGELANETRCFKFWSLKPSAPRERILEEFVDGVHFILSLGIELGYDQEEFIFEEIKVETDNVQAFINIYGQVNSFWNDPSILHFHKLLEGYLGLAQNLGFHPEEIEQAYRAKNDVNFQRQHEGY